MPQATKRQLARLSQALFWAGIVLLVLATAAGLIVVASRRFRAHLDRGDGPCTPTPCEDLWSMHKLPPDVDEDDDGPRPGEPPGTSDDDRIT